MVIYDEEAAYNIWHMMIDKDSQGRGYGKRAMRRALDYISTRSFGAAEMILLTCKPDNKAAYALYLHMGFAATGRRDEDECELGMKMPSATDLS